jgi:hypothetical protein
MFLEKLMFMSTAFWSVVPSVWRQPGFSEDDRASTFWAEEYGKHKQTAS